MRLLAAFFVCFTVGCVSRPIVVPPPTTEMPSPDAKPLNAPCDNKSKGAAWVSLGKAIIVSANLPACKWED